MTFDLTFNVPCVPTGMKTGVRTSAWGKDITEARALVVEHSASTRKVSADLEDALAAAVGEEAMTALFDDKT